MPDLPWPKPENPTRIVVFHWPCSDGAAAAAATAAGLGLSHHEAVTDTWFCPAQYDRSYQRLFHSMVKGGTIDEVYFVDFSEPYEDLLMVAGNVKKLVVLDHHKTAEADLVGRDWPTNTEIVFDQARSGAGIAWDYFHPGTARPNLIRHVEDRDIWKWEHEGSRAFNDALGLETDDYNTWCSLLTAADDNRVYQDMLRVGNTINMFRNVHIHRVLSAQHNTITLNSTNGTSHTVPVYNSPSFQSELGHAAAKLHSKAPFVAIWYNPKPGIMRFSLRVSDESNFDASTVAKYYGGGGHAKACGFEVKDVLTFSNLKGC